MAVINHFHCVSVKSGWPSMNTLYIPIGNLALTCQFIFVHI